MATTRVYRCENCGVLVAAGEKSEWFYNEEGTWCHSCDSGHVGGRVLLDINAVIPNETPNRDENVTELAEQLRQALKGA